MTAQKQFKLNKTEREIFDKLTSPFKIQNFLDSLPYSDEERYRSPRSILLDKKAHCFDGAIFAAAALRMIGYAPVLTELLPNDRDDDHILALFRRGVCWGAVAKSNFVGLRYREPVYKNLRELVMSYFESYYNIAGERTLVGYTAPMNLKRFDTLDWMVNDKAMDVIGNALDDVRQFRIITPAMARNLTHIDSRSYKAGLTGANPSGLFHPQD